MKVFSHTFFFFLLVGIPLVTAAQPDTISFSIKNTWSLDCFGGKQGQNPPYSHCDTNKKFSVNAYYVFDSLKVSNDSITFFKDTSRFDFDSIEIIKDSLMIIFDSTARVLKKIVFGTYSNFKYPNGLPDPTESNQSEMFFLTNVPVHRVGRDLVGELTGTDILPHDLQYSNYFKSSNLYTGEYSENSNGLLPLYNDSSGVSIKFSTMGILDVRAQFKQLKEIAIRPNPASTIITVSFSGQTRDIEFYDLLGRRLIAPILSTNDDEYSCNVSSFPPGIYWLRAGGEVRKFVIAR
jgi:hypothetical protein